MAAQISGRWQAMPDLLLRDTDPDDLRAAIVADVIKALTPMLADSNQPQLVDGDRMAELASVSRPTIDRAVRDDIIPSVKIGRRRLFEPRAVIGAWTIEKETESEHNHAGGSQP